MSQKPARLWPDSASILERSRGVFFARWGELLQLRRAIMKSSNLDDIHDLRIASRRFRAALELFYPFLPKSQKTELRRCVRKLTQVLGGLRNIDEAVLFFQSRVRTAATADTTLITALSRLRPGELKRIEKKLKKFDHRTLDRMVREMVSGVNEFSLTQRNSVSLLAYFSDVSIRHYLPVHRLLAVSTAPEYRTSRHALRIAIKKWRYFFEIIATILDREYTPVLELLKEYQSLLGRMNDIAEFQILLGNLKLTPGEREYADATFRAEETHLLESFTALIERKPLAYTFLI